uniref:Ubiquitin-activating enzyme E1 FCCH domain-containing protein n=1 Tax=Hucho hucho TaxID=62062 RepID=A0A4W5R4I0_9TELE
MDSRTHGLQTGQSVLFREVNGMETLNGTARQVTVLSPYSFTIGDTSCLQPYAHGGFFLLVKTPRTYSFETMEQQLSEPHVLTPDFSKPEVRGHRSAPVCLLCCALEPSLSSFLFCPL